MLDYPCFDMIEQYKKNMKNFLIFLFLGLLLSFYYLFNSDINPLVFSQNHSVDLIKNLNTKIIGRITSTDNYLGIISIRFNQKQIQKIGSEFRIKELKSLDWYHVATIEASQFSALPLYPFGFPVIENSRGKTYEFEIELLDKTGNRKLELSREKPVLISQYKYPKEVLLNHPNLLVSFIYKKISYYITSKKLWKIFTVYSLPALFYFIYSFILFNIVDKKYKKRFENHISFIFKPITIIVLIVIYVDIFIRKYSDTSTLLLTLA